LLVAQQKLTNYAPSLPLSANGVQQVRFYLDVLLELHLHGLMAIQEIPSFASNKLQIKVRNQAFWRCTYMQRRLASALEYPWLNSGADKYNLCNYIYH
jgi:hypothetical protein